MNQLALLSGLESRKRRSFWLLAGAFSVACLIPPTALAAGRPTPPAQGRPLSQPQRDALARNGFVIGADSDAENFHLGYVALFKAHQPVYITADSILHAVHASFDHILFDLERDALIGDLGSWLDEMRARLRNDREGSAQARADLDLYLAVPAALLREQPAQPVAGADAGQIAALAQKAKSAAGKGDVQLFGRDMSIDFSMMKPRGHYTWAPELSRYFMAMTWLGRTEIRIAERQDHSKEWSLNRRALEAAALLSRLSTARADRAWHRIDDSMRSLIGPSDSMSFPGLDRALGALGKPNVAGLAALSDGDIVRAMSVEAQQKIGSQLLREGAGTIALLPFGQRYVFDSDVFSAVTYGRLSAKRMMPSPLDVAAAVFHNPAATALLKDELARYKYQNALDAIARQGEQMGPALWQGSLLHLWLAALRELSVDKQRDAKLPAFMRGEAWSRRLLNTQLASWAELRHDTILYAKQSFTAMPMCVFPDAYVDPYPGFFASLERLADRGTALVNDLEFRDSEQKKRVLHYFGTLRATAGQLRAMAELERSAKPLRKEDIDFVNHAVSIDGRSGGCVPILQPGGWYADLYYDREDILLHKPTIADVHTQATDEVGNPVGKILHVATGRPQPFIVNIQTCDGPRAFRGYVSSYFERVTSHFERLTDEDWSSEYYRKPSPPPPSWLNDIEAR
jgi:hypothetical protein